MIHLTPEIAIWLILVAIGLTLTMLSHREISFNQRARKAELLPPPLRAAALEILLTDRVDETGRSLALLFALGAGLVAPFLRPVLLPDQSGFPSLGQIVSLLLLLMLGALDLSAGLCYHRNHTRSHRLIRDAEDRLKQAGEAISDAGVAIAAAGAEIANAGDEADVAVADARARAVQDVGVAREQVLRDVADARASNGADHGQASPTS